MENDLKGKTVVITGASAGLGRAMAREFAKHGWKVALIARNRDALTNALAEVQKLGGKGRSGRRRRGGRRRGAQSEITDIVS